MIDTGDHILKLMFIQGILKVDWWIIIISQSGSPVELPFSGHALFFFQTRHINQEIQRLSKFLGSRNKMGTILIPLYVPQKILAVDWKSLVKLGKLKKKHGAGSSKSRHYKSSHQKETMLWCWKNGGNHGIYFQHECVLSHMHCNDSRGPTLVHQQRPFLGYPMFKRSKVVEVCWIKIPVFVESASRWCIQAAVGWTECRSAIPFDGQWQTSVARPRVLMSKPWRMGLMNRLLFSTNYLVVRIQRSYAHTMESLLNEELRSY